VEVSLNSSVLKAPFFTAVSFGLCFDIFGGWASTHKSGFDNESVLTEAISFDLNQTLMVDK
jgi:hypothetical protein